MSFPRKFDPETAARPPQARYRQAQKARGRCIVCPERAEKGRRRCSYHLQVQRETEAKRRARRAAE